MTRPVVVLFLIAVLLLIFVGVRDEIAASSGATSPTSLRTSLERGQGVGAVQTNARLASRPKHHWHVASTTAYATFEDLTGCTRPGRCQTACGPLLDDRLFTVAASPSLGLECFQRITVCDPWPHWRCRRATVNDVTLSRFHLEFSFALSLAVWRDRAGWDSPRTAIWRVGW